MGEEKLLTTRRVGGGLGRIQEIGTKNWRKYLGDFSTWFNYLEKRKGVSAKKGVKYF